MLDPDYRKSSNPSGFRLLGGGMILLIGLVILLNALHIVPPVRIHVSDILAVALILLGISIGARSRFKNIGALVLIFVGAAKLIPVFPIINGVYSNELFWPMLLIILGLGVIFRKRQPRFRAFTTPPNIYRPKGNYMSQSDTPVISASDTLNVDVCFGGRKEIVTSKSFRGGSIRTTFAGTEINLAQADGQIQPMVLDIRVAFGSVELIVPSHWEVKNEIAPTFGSVDDLRTIHTPVSSGSEARILVLRGSCNCGSVEIKSY